MTTIPKNELYIGFMSGTSLDGVDASLIRTNGIDEFEAIENVHVPYHVDFRNKMQKFLGLEKLAPDLEKQLTEFHIEAAHKLLKKKNLKSSEIRALGFHGQTIYHKPQDSITIQAGDPDLLARRTNIDVVYDFRKRDVSLGGEGAPLVPIFHKLLMRNQDLPVAVINIGGVANITYIEKENLVAFDTGPGVALIDDAMNRYFQKPFDENGKVAATGKIDYTIVEQTLANEYFITSSPKSLDRNTFKFLESLLEKHEAKDIIATLTYISAATIADSISKLPQIPKEIFLCGGGSKNSQMIYWLKEILSSQSQECIIENISSIDNLNPDYIESQAFGYLAARFLHKLPSTFPSTTNTKEPTICGCLIETNKLI